MSRIEKNVFLIISTEYILYDKAGSVKMAGYLPVYACSGTRKKLGQYPALLPTGQPSEDALLARRQRIVPREE